MIQRRIMLIGATGCGKSSLAGVLNQYGEGAESEPQKLVRRGQEVRYGKHTVDVPGAYFENPRMYDHLIALAQNHASHVLFLVSQSQRSIVGAPNFASVFSCPVTGVITHSDVSPENEAFCLKQLKQYGVPEPYFHVSVTEQTGISALVQHLFDARM